MYSKKQNVWLGLLKHSYQSRKPRHLPVRRPRRPTSCCQNESLENERELVWADGRNDTGQMPAASDRWVRLLG